MNPVLKRKCLYIYFLLLYYVYLNVLLAEVRLIFEGLSMIYDLFKM